MLAAEYPVFIKRGDATAEVQRLLAGIRAVHGGSDADAGLRQMLYVTRADQTVVILTDRGSTLAEALRGMGGWTEPRER